MSEADDRLAAFIRKQLHNNPQQINEVLAEQATLLLNLPINRAKISLVRQKIGLGTLRQSVHRTINALIDASAAIIARIEETTKQLSAATASTLYCNENHALYAGHDDYRRTSFAEETSLAGPLTRYR